MKYKFSILIISAIRFLILFLGVISMFFLLSLLGLYRRNLTILLRWMNSNPLSILFLGRIYLSLRIIRKELIGVLVSHKTNQLTTLDTRFEHKNQLVSALTAKYLSRWPTLSYIKTCSWSSKLASSKYQYFLAFPKFPK